MMVYVVTDLCFFVRFFAWFHHKLRNSMSHKHSEQRMFYEKQVSFFVPLFVRYLGLLNENVICVG